MSLTLEHFKIEVDAATGDAGIIGPKAYMESDNYDERRPIFVIHRDDMLAGECDWQTRNAVQLETMRDANVDDTIVMAFFPIGVNVRTTVEWSRVVDTITCERR